MKRVVLLSVLWAGCVATARHAEISRSASTHTCDALLRCGKVGAGKQFADMDSCRIDYDAIWSKKWDKATCDKKVSQPGLDVCLAAIDSTDCDSVLDFLNTALNKCAERRVCGDDK